MIFQFEDGDVEIQDGDAYGGPNNSLSPMNVNCGAMFYKTEGENWKRFDDFKSGHKARLFLESCKSVADFLEKVI